MEESDEILVRSSRSGDWDAYSRLIERHMRDVYAFAFRMTGNHADADDVAQQAFVNAYANLGKMVSDAGFRAWVFTIAGNVARDMHRRKSIRREVALTDRHQAGPDGEFDPVQSAIRNENGAKVWEALESLPPEQRAVLILHGLHEVPMSELARAENTPEATVRWRFSKALGRLKAAFGARTDACSRGDEG